MCHSSPFRLPTQALRAVQELNESELQGRNILVREDREDRDVKGDGERPGRGRGRSERGGRSGDYGGRRGRAPRGPRGGGRSMGRGREGQSSGFQVGARLRQICFVRIKRKCLLAPPDRQPR